MVSELPGPAGSGGRGSLRLQRWCRSPAWRPGASFPHRPPSLDLCLGCSAGSPVTPRPFLSLRQPATRRPVSGVREGVSVSFLVEPEPFLLGVTCQPDPRRVPHSVVSGPPTSGASQVLLEEQLPGPSHRRTRSGCLGLSQKSELVANSPRSLKQSRFLRTGTQSRRCHLTSR